jgi:CubicO group peptidase (beta-lactamase class C family)
MKANYDSLFKVFIKANKIKNVSVSLFSSNKILWTKSYGKLPSSEKISQETLFSIQSVTKPITSTLAMIAVQENLIDLDTSINEYLPDFTVNSVFEDNPAEKITIRHLLSCTAGFTHEAPIGNNYDASFQSNKEHWQSITETWLKYPVGLSYSYSNLGFDLLAQIIEKMSGISYSDFCKTKIFRPLKMPLTTVDVKEILSNKNRVIGKSFGFKSLPTITPMIGAGGVYSCVQDLTKFVQLHLRNGRTAEKEILEPKFLQEMYKPVLVDNYALGVSIIDEGESYALNHNGEGFGFGASIKWYPEYDIGCVILSNKENSSILYDFISTILTQHTKDESLIQLKNHDIMNPLCKIRNNITSVSKKEIVSDFFESLEQLDKSNWDKYRGSYHYIMGGGFEFKWYAKIAKYFGFRIPKISVVERDNLYLNVFDGNSYEEKRLYQIKKDLFFTIDGECLNFTKEKPRYRSIQIHKVSN